MDTTGLDVTKLKAIIIELWRTDFPNNRPIKVLPLARTVELEKQQGHTLDSITGYITSQKFVVGKMPTEMEDILGLARGSYASGVSVWALKTLPGPNEFDVRGYTYLPDGEPFDGTVIRTGTQSRPKYFDKNGAQSNYPPGLGAPQWKLTANIPAIELQRVLPGNRFVFHP